MQGSNVTERLDGTLNGARTLVAPMTDSGDQLYIGSHRHASNCNYEWHIALVSL